MKKLELQAFGVQELVASEQIIVDGGNLPKLIKGGIWGYLASQIIDHWSEVKKGFIEGYNAQL